MIDCPMAEQGTMEPNEMYTSTELDIAMNNKSGFKHPVINPKTQMRFIKIQSINTDGTIECQFVLCDMRDTDSAASGVRYTALSYTWGTVATHRDMHGILVDGRRFYVRSNLWHFLKLASRTMIGTLFFIDALCIDQSNLNEKGHQVRLMTAIYHSAYEVVVWLGLPDDDSLLHAGLRSLQEKSEWTLTDKRTVAIENRALDFLGGVPYWRRTWVVQEFILGSRIRVLCGDYNFPWAKFASLWPQSLELSKMRIDSDGSALLHNSLVKGRMSISGHSPFLQIVEHKLKCDTRKTLPQVLLRKPVDRHNGQKLGVDSATLVPAYVALSAFGGQECSNPRDKLYGMLGIIECAIRASIIPDYESGMQHVYRTALLACIKSARLHLEDVSKLLNTCLSISAGLHNVFGLEEEEIRDCRAELLSSSEFQGLINEVFDSVIADGCDSCREKKKARECPIHHEYISQLQSRFKLVVDSCRTSEAFGGFKTTRLRVDDLITSTNDSLHTSERNDKDVDKHFVFTARRLGADPAVGFVTSSSLDSESTIPPRRQIFMQPLLTK